MSADVTISLIAINSNVIHSAINTSSLIISNIKTTIRMIVNR